MKNFNAVEKYHKKICRGKENTRLNKIFSKRCYMMYLISGNNEFLKKAYFQTIKDFRTNPSDLELLLLNCLFCIETNNMNTAQINLKRISTYKNYIKTYMTKTYSAFLYLCILFFIKNGSIENIDKYEKMLFDYFKVTNCHYAEIFLSAIQIEIDNFSLAKKYLDDLCDKNENSFFLFITMIKYFKSKNKSIYCTERIFIPFIKWAFSHDLDIESIVDFYSEKIISYFSSNQNFFIKLYEKYPNENILKEICKTLISKKDYSIFAFQFYKQAISKQMYLSKLNTFFVKSASENRIKDIAIYPIKVFLQSDEPDDTIKPYLYHILITNKKFKDLLIKYSNDIIDFAVYAIKNERRNIYLNSVFKYIVENENYYPELSCYIEKAKSILKDEIFLYDIFYEDAYADFCYISEKERKGVKKYKLKNGKCVIKAVSDKFSIYVSDEKCRFFSDTNIKITKHVENADFKLYKSLYNYGVESEELIIALSECYINIENSKDSSVSFIENLIQKLADNKNVSDDLKMKAFFALGNIEFASLKYDGAAYYYEQVDNRFIKDKFVENVFTAFLNANKVQKAVDIMTQRSNFISDLNLKEGIKKIFIYEKFRSIAANLSYELIIKSNHDKFLIDIVIDYYRGGILDWQNLSCSLHESGSSDIRIDERVLEIALWTRSFDETTQYIFNVVYSNNKEAPVVNEFLKYCCYEIIVNHSQASNEVISILEKVFFETKDEMFAYALSHLYIAFNIHTDFSEQIINEAIEAMKLSGFLFPIFKENLYLFPEDEYIHKNYPFIYFASPNKTILLYYREKGNADFNVTIMNYFNFGMYILALPVFYSETIEYYICEQMNGGSVETKKKELFNNSNTIFEDLDDLFFEINNAIIYEKMFKYDKVESIIDSRLKEDKKIRGTLL